MLDLRTRTVRGRPSRDGGPADFVRGLPFSPGWRPSSAGLTQSVARRRMPHFTSAPNSIGGLSAAMPERARDVVDGGMRTRIQARAPKGKLGGRDDKCRKAIRSGGGASPSNTRRTRSPGSGALRLQWAPELH
jgi:hypothetical protein